MRKYEAIDLMKLYTHGSSNGWNDFLTECYNKNDINKLAVVKYRISAGMDDLAKQKLNSDAINVQFVRWVRSIEVTARKIIKKLYPLPNDTIVKSELDVLNKVEKEKMMKAKQLRDRALQDFMRKSSY